MQNYTLKSENIKNWIIKSWCAIDIYFYIYLTKLWKKWKFTATSEFTSLTINVFSIDKYWIFVKRSMIGQCRFRSTNQIKAFRSKETWRNWVKKKIYVSFSLILKQNSSNFPNIYSENAGDNARFIGHRDSGP